MKKDIFSLLVIAVLGTFLFASCKKNYRCQCAFRNQIKLDKDLGSQTKEDAKAICNSYDTTVPGEKWKCVIK
jgi:hypothetical protein